MYASSLASVTAFSVNLVRSESKVHLLCVSVNVHGNGCVCFSVDFFARWQSSDEVSVDDLLGSLRHGDWKCSWFRVRDQLETLTLFTASNVLVNEGTHEWPSVVSFNEFQGEVVAWMSSHN